MKKMIFILLATALTVSAQTELADMQNLYGGIDFHHSIAAFASPDDSSLSRVDIYIQIKNDRLQFIKLEDGYEANYEVSIIVLDDDDYQVDGKIIKNTVYADTYESTNSREKFASAHESFTLKPGDYEISISVEDDETAQSKKVDEKIRVPDFDESKISISDIIFADSLFTNTAGVQQIDQTISDSRKGFHNTVYAYFEIYNNTAKDTKAKIEYELRGSSTRFQYKNDFEINLLNPRNAQLIMIPADSLIADEYLLKIKIESRDDAETEKNFFIRWQGMPVTAKDVDSAIEQLQYIASPEEWKKLQKAPAEKKAEYFQEFWEQHDPTPGTEVNEAMESHYARIDYANRSFSVLQREGWKTDMGMVYVILGAPDEVERNVFPRFSQYPYEVWHYYRYNKYFEFYDPTGFGDYRLVTPFSLYELQRLIGN